NMRRGTRVPLFCLLLAACGDDGGAHRATATPTAVPTPTPAGAVALIETDATLELRTASAALVITRNPFRLALADHAGDQIAAQVAGRLRALTDGGECAVTALGAFHFDPAAGRLDADVQTSCGAGALAVEWPSERAARVVFSPPASSPQALADTWALAPGERIYGLSERLSDSRPLNDVPGILQVDEINPRQVGSLDRRGEQIAMLVQGTVGVYAPFYQSSAGYGLYVEGTAVGAYDVGASDDTALDFRFTAGTTPASSTLRYVLFAGTPPQILDAYTALTGRPFIPPAWAFRHWRWRDEAAIGPTAVVDGEAMNAQVAEDLTMYQALDIPPGIYMIDRPWADGAFGFDDFQWDPQRFPNPEGMLRVIRDRGYRVAVWSAALATGTAPGTNGAQARAAGYLAPGLAPWPDTPDAQVLDITNPAVRDWWTEKHVEFLRRWDISAIKLDRGEEYVTQEPTDIFADGRSGVEVRNDFPVLNLHLYHDLLETARGAGDFVVTARSAYAGGQHWGIVWGGDSPGSRAFGAGPGTDLGLRSAIIGQQRAAFLGFPFWGSDTGGYYQFKQRDVFARWLEFSAFCALMEIGGHEAHAPWDMPTEPHYDGEMIAIFRRYVRLHHDLIPYTMRQAEEAARSGLPIARPLVFAYPDDAAVADRWDEYLFGADLLVAPVWQNGARSREVYLPAGRWEDFWESSRTFDGPQTVAVDAPLDVIPVFVREGAVVEGRP
ncbi:MAG TPA: TIM-barrel domain-containing protein, partial [Candidatus Dormibacteraeota bacterium]|nr:TIM-barrel domain-containing protein [Candidatus Dormibacteraeota bacterium]